MIRRLREPTLYFIIPICIFFLLKKGIDGLLKRFIVDPVFSVCTPPNIIYDIAVILLFLALSIPLLYKVFKGAKIPRKWFYIGLTYFFIYTFYRVSNSPFHFTSLSFSRQIMLLDIINLIPLVLTLGYVVIESFSRTFFRGSAPAKNEFGFAVDEAKRIDESNDLLNRIKFIKQIAAKIKNTETKTGSFPIGIVANWGTGKSTFINSLVNEFPKNEFVVIELNVWKCNNAPQIIETLFKLLKQGLAKYSFTINNKLQDYTTNLLKGTKNEGLNGIKNISELLLPDSSIEKQYDSINDEIKRIGRKIIIVIDDIDRLDKKEIYEVIKLIRNTASFSNTFFVVAYDRNYILNAIEEINTYQSHYFLEKIFQVEFTLPPISNEIIQSEITKRIEPFLTDAGKKEYKLLTARGLNFFDYGYADLTTMFVFNIRDVVRFINSFQLNYEFVKDEIYLPDFYNLQLIRFKHPELFLEIYRNRYDLFTTDKDDIHKPATKENLYSLTRVYDNGKITGDSVMSVYLNNHRSFYKLSTKEINIICGAFSSIFPEMGSLFGSEKHGLNYRLTALKPSMFDRYFILDIEGKLSEVLFSNVRALSQEKFIQKLAEWSLNKDIVFDVSERLAEIRNFDNKEDFIKIITGIFYFANLNDPNIENNERRLIGFNGEALAYIIGDTKNQEFFASSEEYKNFLLSFLGSKNDKYTYTDEFIKGLLHRSYYFVSEIFKSEELSEITVKNFEFVLSKSDKLTWDIWRHMWNCENRNETPTTGGVTEVNYPISKKALRAFRKFIFEKDLDGFLLSSIREIPFDKKFIIEGAITTIFKRTDIFIWLLKRYNKESIYKDEFLNLYDQLASNPEYKGKGVPIGFFKSMPVALRKD